ncbi:MAG TPA: hypothetical protein ENJ80_08170 [Gammaproteobacteria bacterium]|nr:hypothetical protein [Gammaproteobacteria bacterium]
MPKQKKQIPDWWIIAGIAMLSLVLGMVGFYQYSQGEHGSPLSLLDLLYLSLQLFTLESGGVQGPLPVTLEMARWLAPFTGVFAAIKGVLSLIHRQGKSLLRLRNIQDHAIVCGASQGGVHIARELVKNGVSVVVIDNTPPDVSPYKPDPGIIQVAGNVQDAAVLQRAKVQTARYLFAATDRDADNIGVVHEAHRIVGAREREQDSCVLDCYAHVSDHRTRALFYTHPLFSDSGKRFNAQVFSLFDRGARLLFESFAPDRYRPIQGRDDSPVSIMIFGFSPLAKSLVLHVARIGHYANGRKVVISLIDEQAARQTAALSLSTPALEQLVDIKPQDLPIDGLSAACLQEIIASPADVIYICAESDIQAFTLARRLVSLPGYEDIPIVAALLQTDALTELLYADRQAQPDNVELFSLLGNTGDMEQLIGEQQDEAAKIIHELYREDQFGQGETVESNASLAPWENLPEGIKDSNRGQADHLPIKLRAIGLSLDDVLNAAQAPEFTPEQIHTLADMEHRRWVAEKRLAGWRPTAGEKDSKRKLTPLLVDFDSLPDAEKRKDERAVVLHSLRLIENLKLRSVQPHAPGREPASR